MKILSFVVVYLIIGFMGAIAERGVFGETVFVMTAWLLEWPLLLLIYLMVGLSAALIVLNGKITRATAGFNRWGRELLESLFS